MPREFENLSKEVSEGAQDVEKSLEGIVGAAEKADTAHANLSKTQKSSLQISKKFASAVTDLNKRLGSTAKISHAVASGIGSVAQASKGLVVDMSDLSRVSDGVARGLDDVASATSDMKDAGVGAVRAVAGLAKESKVLVKETKKVDNAQSDSAEAMMAAEGAADSLGGEMNRLASVTDLVRSKFSEGRQEAESFASGLGASSGVMLGAGVAAIFLARKISDLIERFAGAAVELASFNVEMNRLAMITPGVDTSQLVSLRKELNLTRAQATEFYKVLQEGAQTGVVTVNELTTAAAQLREAFGGDPTERLREFVKLVEEIPTLKTDISVTASLDDQTASLFALAKAGKISTVIEMQTAGLLGGANISVTSPEDVKLLNAQQKSLRVQEDIRDFFLNKMFPTWGPQFTTIMGATITTAAAIAGVIATMGFLKIAMSSQIVAQKETTAAILGTTAAGIPQKRLFSSLKKVFSKRGNVAGAFRLGKFRAGTTGMRGIGGGVRGVGDLFTSGGFSVGLKKATGLLLRFKGGVGSATSGLVKVFKMAGGGIAGPAALVGVALGLAGKAADWLSEKLKDSGNETASAYAEVTATGLKAAGTISSFAAAGAVAGSILPGIGTAAGAVIGGLVGLTKVLVTSRRKIKESTALAAAQNRAQKQMHKSALALERHLNALARVTNTAKVQLADLQSEVAGIELDFLREMGGTVRQFNMAISNATDATTRKFKILNRGLTQRRVAIARDADLTNSERRAFLNELKKSELEATQEFIRGLSKVIDGLLKTPGIIADGLKREIVGQRLDFGISAGSLGMEALVGSISRELDFGKAQINKIFDQFTEIRKTSEKRRKIFEEETKRGKGELESALSGIPDIIKKRFKIIDIDIENLKPEEFEKVIENASDGIKKMNKRIEDATKGLVVVDEGGAKKLSEKAVSLTKRLKDVERELNKETKIATDSTKDIDKQLAAQKKAKELVSKQKVIREEQANIEESTARWARKQGASEEAVVILQKKVLEGRLKEKPKLVGFGAGVREQVLTAPQKEAADLVKKMLPLEEKFASALNKQVNLIKGATGLSQVLTVVKKLQSDQSKFQNKELEEQLKIERRIFEVESEINRTISKGSAEAVNEVRVAKRRANLIKDRQRIDELAGRGLENLVKQNEANNDVARKTVAATKLLVSLYKKEQESLEERLKGETNLDQISFTERLIESTKSKINDLKRAGLSAEQGISETFKGLENALSSALAGPAGRKALAEIDLSDTLFELARFSDEAKQSLESTLQIAQRANRKKAEIEKKAAEESFKDAVKRARKARRKGEISSGLESELVEAAEREKQVALEQSKTNFVKKQLDDVKKMVDVRREELDITQSGREDEMSFLSDMGANWRRIMELQGEMVGFAREKARLAQEELDFAIQNNAGSSRLADLQVKAQKAQFDLIRKSVGVQRDIYEKLLGKVFGEIRGGVGARRGRGEAAAKFGLERTRAVAAGTGFFIKAGPGGVKTIKQRSIERQIGTIGMTGGSAPVKFGAEGRLRKSLRGQGGGTLGPSGASRLGSGGSSTLGGMTSRLGGGGSSTLGSRKPSNIFGGASGGMTPGVKQAAAFSAKPGLAAVGGVRAGESAEAPTMKIKGELRVDMGDLGSRMATLVASVINTSQVRTSMEKGGVMFS